jgi:hypothetical protein
MRRESTTHRASIAAVLVVLIALLGGLASSADARGIKDAKHFKGFDVYFAGQGVLRYPLAEFDVFQQGRRGEVDAFYGRCKRRHGGCSYQLEIDNTSICRTYPDRYYSPPKLRRINGTWGGWIRTSKIFDVYTGRTAVSIFGLSRRRAKHVARELRNVRVRERSAHLPTVKEKFLKGKAHCQR